MNRLRRWRYWILLIVLVLAARVALPEILRRVLIARASEALHATVEIGDVDLSLLRGGIALEDVAIRAAPAADSSTNPPDISWKRFAVEVRWLPLFRKTVRLREIVLESPH